MENEITNNLKEHEPRDLFLTEAGHFTPWLANNIHLISQIIGYKVVVLDTEYILNPTNRRIDILGITSDKQNYVIIENQLETADLDHFSRIQLYISLIKDQINEDTIQFEHPLNEKIIVVWIAKDFSSIMEDLADLLDENPNIEVHLVDLNIKALLSDEAKYVRPTAKQILENYDSSTDIPFGCNWPNNKLHNINAWNNKPTIYEERNKNYIKPTYYYLKVIILSFILLSIFILLIQQI